jgi:hypothetical protein
MVQAILKAKASVDEGDKYGRTALMFATGWGVIPKQKAFAHIADSVTWTEKKWVKMIIMPESHHIMHHAKPWYSIAKLS